jgi:hypothetical protein
VISEESGRACGAALPGEVTVVIDAIGEPAVASLDSLERSP